MEQIETGSSQTIDIPADPRVIRIVSWNINRGLQLPGLIEFLGNASADLILLQEVDVNARRTQYRNVAREIAQALRMNYVFGREFEELTQGSQSSPAYQGQATLSRFPISSSRIVRFHRQSGFWRPRWFIPEMQKSQRRLGARMSLVSHITWSIRPLIVYNLHLESRGNDELRRSQLAEVLNDARQYDSELSVVIAGDFNLDLSREPAVPIIGERPFNNPFNKNKICPATSRSRLGRGRTIDGIFTRGRLTCVGVQVHDSVLASDHYPISVTLMPS
jgi:endonuclease/exonuclease/phosphatase family metal-dependent hydrolase